MSNRGTRRCNTALGDKCPLEGKKDLPYDVSIRVREEENKNSEGEK